MKWKILAALVACVPVFAADPAFVLDLSTVQLNNATGNLRIQLDNMAKDISRLTESSNLQAIYRNLDDQLKGVCKVIYCDDDRKNYVDAAPIEQKAADSTLLFVRQGRLVPEPKDGFWSLPAATAGLCTPTQIADLNRTRAPKDQYPPERFYDEPAPGFCTGFKVGKDLIATAGHCVKDALDCQSIRMVTGYHMGGIATQPNKNIAADRVFACMEIVGRTQTGDGPDWAVVRVDREMTSVPQVKLRDSGSPAAAAALTVVGYPVGLPVKIAGGANIRAIKPHFFVTNTDTYGGNSGSPVFSSDSLAKGELLVEGILVRGETDFAVETPCRISKRCESKQCRGEDVTLASEFLNTIGK